MSEVLTVYATIDDLDPNATIAPEFVDEALELYALVTHIEFTVQCPWLAVEVVLEPGKTKFDDIPEERVPAAKKAYWDGYSNWCEAVARRGWFVNRGEG